MKIIENFKLFHKIELCYLNKKNTFFRFFLLPLSINKFSGVQSALNNASKIKYKPKIYFAIYCCSLTENTVSSFENNENTCHSPAHSILTVP